MSRRFDSYSSHHKVCSQYLVAENLGVEEETKESLFSVASFDGETASGVDVTLGLKSILEDSCPTSFIWHLDAVGLTY